MAFPTRLTKVGYSSEHFNERTGMCYHQTPPWERVVAYVGDARQAKPHLEHNPLSLLGVRHAIPTRKLNDPGRILSPLTSCWWYDMPMLWNSLRGGLLYTMLDQARSLFETPT